MFTVKNLCEVLVRRWFKNEKYEVALFGEDIVYPTVIDYRPTALAGKARKPISQLINLTDVAAVYQLEEVLKLEYQVKEAGTSRNENAQLGKRQQAKHDSLLDIAPKLTPNLKKRDNGLTANLGHLNHEDDYLSLFDNPENTNNLSLMLGMKNENSMLSNAANGFLNGGDLERSNFNDHSNFDLPERQSTKKPPKQSRGTSNLPHVEGNSQLKTEMRTTFTNIKQEEYSRKSLGGFKPAKVESLKLEATPSHSDGEQSPGKLLPLPRKEAEPKSTSDMSFELQVQMLKEKIEKIDKEKLSIINSGRDKK